MAPDTTLPHRLNRRRALGGYAWLAGLLYCCLFSLASYAGFVALSITSHLVLAQCNGDLPHPPHPPLAPHRPLHPGYGRSLELSLHALHGPSGGYPSPSTHLRPALCAVVNASLQCSPAELSHSHTLTLPHMLVSCFVLLFFSFARPAPTPAMHCACSVTHRRSVA